MADGPAQAEVDCSRNPLVLAGGLRELGHDVRLLVVEDAPPARGGTVPEAPDPDAVVPLAPARAGHGLASLAVPPDVVLSVGLSAPIAAAVLAESLGVPLVVSLPAAFFGSCPPAHGYGRLVCRHLPCSCLVVECDRHRLAAQALGADPHRVFVVPPGIRLDGYGDPRSADADRDESRGVAADPLRVLFDASRTSAEEQRFLEGVLTRLARERRRNIRTVVRVAAANGSGAGSAAELWRDRPDTLVVASDDGAKIANLFAGSDLVVIPSATADESVTALRAMAAGRPLVAADCPSIRDVVSTARYGVLARPGWTDEWIDKLDYLIAERAVRLHIGRSARARVETAFSLPQTLQQLDDRLVAVTATWRYDVVGQPAMD